MDGMCLTKIRTIIYSKRILRDAYMYLQSISICKEIIVTMNQHHLSKNEYLCVLRCTCVCLQIYIHSVGREIS